jgi:hypothetical protein
VVAFGGFAGAEKWLEYRGMRIAPFNSGFPILTFRVIAHGQFLGYLTLEKLQK